MEAPVTDKTIEIFESIEELSQCAAELFMKESELSVARHGRFSVALSGGSTPGPLYCLLSTEKYRMHIDWEQVHIFWTDERCVPPNHPESNFKLASDLLLSKLSLPNTNIHRIPGELSEEKAALAYEKDLLCFFSGCDIPRFDLIFLGVGEDGHTASIFPGIKAADTSPGLAVPVHANKLGWNRVTLSYAVLNSAATVAFLVTGKAKASVIREILEGNNQILPAARVHPEGGRTLWLLDRDAASVLKNRNM